MCEGRPQPSEPTVRWTKAACITPPYDHAGIEGEGGKERIAAIDGHRPKPCPRRLSKYQTNDKPDFSWMNNAMKPAIRLSGGAHASERTIRSRVGVNRGQTGSNIHNHNDGPPGSTSTRSFPVVHNANRMKRIHLVTGLSLLMFLSGTQLNACDRKPKFFNPVQIPSLCSIYTETRVNRKWTVHFDIETARRLKQIS